MIPKSFIPSSTRLLTSGPTSTRNDFAHCIIGGGVVGLAIARKLARRNGKPTVLLERHRALGMETSSRNSEVIHAGLYYPPHSLKTNLCIQGNEMMYSYCDRRRVPYRKTGKWIVAQTAEQLESLQAVHIHATALDVPVRWLSATEVRSREPHVRADAGALESPRTGIVDSHGFMMSLASEFEESGGNIAFASPASAIYPLGSAQEGYSIEVAGEQPTSITADIVVNAGGLGAIELSNSILPKDRRLKPYFCKGTYFSYPRAHPKVQTLIYPAPVKGLGGLGTHLTLDISGQMRFGPDVEWVDDPNNLAPGPTRMREAISAIQSYLPTIDASALAPDYCGIRPKIRPQSDGGVTQVDFIIREEEGFPGFINLLGIESPGLTSSLAIANRVEALAYG